MPGDLIFSGLAMVDAGLMLAGILESVSRRPARVVATFTEAHARLLLGSWMNNMDLLRQVEVVSPSPVLAWDGEKAVLVNRAFL